MIRHLPEGLVPFEDCGYARQPLHPLEGQEIRLGLPVRRPGPGAGNGRRTESSGRAGNAGALLWVAAFRRRGNPALPLPQRGGKHPVVRDGHSSPSFRDPSPSDGVWLGRAGSRRVSVR